MCAPKFPVAYVEWRYVKRFGRARVPFFLPGSFLSGRGRRGEVTVKSREEGHFQRVQVCEMTEMTG